MFTVEDVDALEKLISKVDAVNMEVSILSKKSPNDAINGFKLNLINSILKGCNDFLGEKYKPLLEFDVFDSDDVPSNSDVVFILKQYDEALEKIRSDNIRFDGMSEWYFEVNDEHGNMRAAPPRKLTRK